MMFVVSSVSKGFQKKKKNESVEREQVLDDLYFFDQVHLTGKTIFSNIFCGIEAKSFSPLQRTVFFYNAARAAAYLLQNRRTKNAF